MGVPSAKRADATSLRVSGRGSQIEVFQANPLNRSGLGASPARGAQLPNGCLGVMCILDPALGMSRQRPFTAATRLLSPSPHAPEGHGRRTESSAVTRGAGYRVARGSLAGGDSVGLRPGSAPPRQTLALRGRPGPDHTPSAGSARIATSPLVRAQEGTQRKMFDRRPTRSGKRSSRRDARSSGRRSAGFLSGVPPARDSPPDAA